LLEFSDVYFVGNTTKEVKGIPDKHTITYTQPHRYMNALTPFEQSELLEFSDVYFVGNTTKKVKGMPHSPRNNGYDDERGDYTIV
jgi:hypothetical protein